MKDDSYFAAATSFVAAVHRWADVRGIHPDYLPELATRAGRGLIEDQDAVEAWFRDVLSFLQRIDRPLYERGIVAARRDFMGIHDFLDQMCGKPDGMPEQIRRISALVTTGRTVCQCS